MTDAKPYIALGEREGVAALVGRFYDIMDTAPEAGVIRAMHAEDLTAIAGKLTDYLCEWLGGPKYYSEKTGTVCLTRPHAAYKLDEEARDQWLYCMERALAEQDASEELRELLRQPFFRIADVMRNS